MRKIINVAVIAILVGLFVCLENTYALRIPMGIDKERGIKSLELVKRNEIASLAFSRSVFDNPDNLLLYKKVCDFLNIHGGVGIDVGYGINTLAAQGLIEGSIDKVILMDINSHKKPNIVNEKIVGIAGDAINLPMSDNSCRVIVYNQSFSCISNNAMMNETVKNELSKINQSISSENLFEKIFPLAKELSLREAYRALENGGRVLIKLGGAFEENRIEENAEIEPMLREIGFENINVLYKNNTPVFVFANKPFSTREKLAIKVKLGNFKKPPQKKCTDL